MRLEKSLHKLALYQGTTLQAAEKLITMCALYQGATSQLAKNAFGVARSVRARLQLCHKCCSNKSGLQPLRKCWY